MDIRGLPAIKRYVTGGQIASIYNSLFGRFPTEGDKEGVEFYKEALAGASVPDAIRAISAGAQGGDAEKIARIISEAEAAGRNPVGFDINQDNVVSSADLAYVRGLNEPPPASVDTGGGATGGGDTGDGGGGGNLITNVANAFKNQEEELRNTIVDLYTTQLDRTPSEDEIQGWINRYNDPNYYGEYTLDTLKDEFGAGAQRELGLRARGDYYGSIPKFEPSKVPQFQFPTAPPPRPVLGVTGLAGAPPKNVNDLYQEILRRAPDPEGLDYYTRTFGPTIEPNEVTTFVGGIADPAERGAAQVASQRFLSQMPALVPPEFAARTAGYAQPISAAIEAREAAAAPTPGVRAGGVINYAEGGLAEPTSPRMDAEDLGSRFDVTEYMDEEGRLVGGFSRPIYDENRVITGYDYRPYERDVVFGEELREKEAAMRLTDEEREQMMVEMAMRQGRTGISPTRGGLAGIEIGDPMMRNRPQYYSTVEQFRPRYAKGGLASIAQDLADKGRGGDTMVAHISPQEAGLLKALGGAGTINPETGLPEFFELFPKKGIKLNLGPLGNIKVGAKSSNLLQAAAALAIGDYYNVGAAMSSLAYGGVRAAATGNLAEGIQAGLTAYGMGSTYNQFADVPLGAPGASAPVNVPGSENITSANVDLSAPTSQNVLAAPGVGDNASLSALERAELGVRPPMTSPEQFSAASKSAEITRGQDLLSDPFEIQAVSPDNATAAAKQGFLGRNLPPSVQEYVPDFALDASGKAVATTALLGTSAAGMASDSARAGDLAAQYEARKKKERERFAPQVAYLQSIPIYGRSGGLMKLAGGGMTYMEAGGTTGPTGAPRDVTGTGDGMSDSVPATIEGVQEARLADGEFVIPADVVADIGNGSSDAGSKKLYDMMDRVRKARHGTTEQPPEIKAERLMPA